LLVRRKLVCGLMLGILPSSLTAQDSTAAILRSSGSVMLNGSPAPASSAPFPNDYVQTLPAAAAKIDATGSTVEIQPETFFQFAGDELALEHGTVQLLTFRALKVRVGCRTVTPVSTQGTQYDVTDADGKVTVAARKSDVKIESRSLSLQKNRQAGLSEEIVHAGEQVTRSESCGADLPAPAHANGAILNSPWVIWPTTGVISVGVACWILCHDDDPVSPSKPR
jgi:hypothetical protein